MSFTLFYDLCKVAAKEKVTEYLVRGAEKLADGRKPAIAQVAKEEHPILIKVVSAILGEDESWIESVLHDRKPEGHNAGRCKRRRIEGEEEVQRRIVDRLSAIEPARADVPPSPGSLRPLTPAEEYDTEAELQRVSAFLGAEGALA